MRSSKGYIIHKFNFKNTSLILNVFTEKYGILTFIAKGSRNIKSKSKFYILEFVHLNFLWSGKGSILNLISSEPINCSIHSIPIKEILYNGLYINELIYKLLPRKEEYKKLYNKYSSIFNQKYIEDLNLREFEFFLLKELGYEYIVDIDSISYKKINPKKWYRYIPQKMGVLKVNKKFNNDWNVFIGKNLIKIQNKKWKKSEIMKDLKRILKISFVPLLENKKINSLKWLI